MEEQTQPDPLTDEQLAEADAESDLLDADIEEFEPSAPTADRQRISPDLSPEELAEAEVESDVLDADIEEV